MRRSIRNASATAPTTARRRSLLRVTGVEADPAGLRASRRTTAPGPRAGKADGRIRSMESEARKLCDLGKEFLDRGETEEALRCYERAIDVDPDSPDGW